MGVLSEEMRKEIGRGAAMARDLESWLAGEARDLDGDLSPEAIEEEGRRRHEIAGAAAAVIAMAPQMSAFDIASAVSAMAVEGCRNASGHLLFARSLCAEIAA